MCKKWFDQLKPNENLTQVSLKVLLKGKKIKKGVWRNNYFYKRLTIKFYENWKIHGILQHEISKHDVKVIKHLFFLF